MGLILALVFEVLFGFIILELFWYLVIKMLFKVAA
jgi:hypothetical protein